jgi:death-on-curing protein
MRDYLTTADILGLHHVLLEKYGGSGGLRDLGALEAAVFRPQCGYYNDIIEEAAALLESLLINHPFIDGNKRVAFAACDVFLRLNGHRLTASSAWFYERLMFWINDAENRWELIKNDLKSCISQAPSDLQDKP